MAQVIKQSYFSNSMKEKKKELERVSNRNKSKRTVHSRNQSEAVHNKWIELQQAKSNKQTVGCGCY